MPIFSHDDLSSPVVFDARTAPGGAVAAGEFEQIRVRARERASSAEELSLALALALALARRNAGAP